MAERAFRWRHRTGEIAFDRTQVMGILNVTPDSFSDGGRYVEPQAAFRHALDMVEEGAAILDIGGESTRPGSDPVPAEEEWRRVGPVLESVSQKVDVPISIDTRKPEIAARALRAGASIVNDVSGLRDSLMLKVVAESGAGVVIVHMLGEPKTMQAEPRYEDVVSDVRSFLEGRARLAMDGGVPREAIAVDPGIGFGKGLKHNMDLLHRLDALVGLGFPVVVGASRKSFLGTLGAGGPGDRLPGSLAAGVWAAARGAHVVRVHDVLETVRALRVVDALVQRGHENL